MLRKASGTAAPIIKGHKMAQEGDIEWLTLENKVRRLVKELLEPTVRRVVEDRDQLHKLSKESDVVKRKVDELDFTMAKVAKKLGTLDEVTKRQLDLEAGQKSVETRMTQTAQNLRADMELLTAEIQRKADFIQSFEKRIDTFAAEITGFNGKFAEAQETLKGLLEERFLQFHADLGVIKDDNAVHREMTEGLVQQQTRVNERQGEVEAEMLTQSKALNALRTRTDALELERAQKSSVSSLAEELERLRTKTLNDKDSFTRKLKTLRNNLEVRIVYQSQLLTAEWLHEILDSKAGKRLCERELQLFPHWLDASDFPEELRPQVRTAWDVAKQPILKAKDRSSDALERVSNSSHSRSSSPSRKRRSKVPSKIETEEARPESKPPAKSSPRRHHAEKSPIQGRLDAQTEPRKSEGKTDLPEVKSPTKVLEKGKPERRDVKPVESVAKTELAEVKTIPREPAPRVDIDAKPLPKPVEHLSKAENSTARRSIEPISKPEIPDIRSIPRPIEPRFKPDALDLRPHPRAVESLPPLENPPRPSDSMPLRLELTQLREEQNPTPQFHHIETEMSAAPSVQQLPSPMLRQPLQDLSEERTGRTMVETESPKTTWRQEQVLESEAENREDLSQHSRAEISRDSGSEAASQVASSPRRQESGIHPAEGSDEVVGDTQQRPETKSSVYTVQAHEFVAYFTDDSDESARSEGPDFSEIQGQIDALSERINTETAILRDELSDRYADFMKDIRQNTEACNALSRQVLSECASLHSVRKRDKNDLQKELAGLQNGLEELGKQNEAYLGAAERLAELLAHIVEFCRIELTMAAQDEEDRESIALMGYREGQQSPVSEKPAVVSLDKSCLSCTGQSSIVISAFKMACLAYAPTPLTYRNATFQRKELLDIQRRVLESAWTKANATDPWSRLKLGDLDVQLPGREAALSSKPSPTSWGSPLPPVFAESPDVETKLPALPRVSPSFRRRK